MGKVEKPLDRMRNNPRDWRIEELRSIGLRRGFDAEQNGTSHVVFRHPVAGRLSVPADRPIKPICVKLFIELVDKLEASDES